MLVGSMILSGCVSPSTSSAQSSEEVFSSSLPSEYTISPTETIKADTTSFSDSNGMEYSLGTHLVDDGIFTLEQGGYLTNTVAYQEFTGIKVDYLKIGEFGYLTTKASYYPISSFENGAYELTGDTKFTFPNNESKRYFSIYAPIGTFQINSITLYTASNEVVVPTDNSLDIYTINDTHGADEYEASSYHNGIEKLSGYIMGKQKEAPDNVAVLSSGDMWQGSADSNMTHGQIMIDWMNVVGFESMAIGNHEFDWTADVIAENSGYANYPFLGINILDSNGNRPSWAKASTTFYRGKWKIGVVGAIGMLANSIAVSSLGDYSFSSNYPALIEAEAKRLKSTEGCDLVVLSIHNGGYTTTSGTALDAVLEGHAHKSYQEIDSNGIPHVQTYANGSDFGKLHFVEKNGKLVYSSVEDVPFKTISASEDEPMTSGVYGFYSGQIDTIKNEVLCHSDNELNTEAIQNLAVQTMYEHYRNSSWSSVLAGAFINSGAARQKIPAGDITYGQVYAALPFDNDNVLCTIDGASLKNLMKSLVYYAPDYTDSNSIDSSKTYYVMVISYVSEKSQYDGILNEVKRDNYRIRDIVADYFRTLK